MKTISKASHHHPALQQLQKNASSLVGQMGSSPDNYHAGQIFWCPEDGELENMQVYVEDIARPGKLILTLHQFDNENKTWGPVISGSQVEVNDTDRNRWVQFNLQPVYLHKDCSYGFRLSCHDGLMTVGEAVWTSKDAFAYGMEWKSRTPEKSDIYYKYFSLAFKIELKAA